MKEAYYFSHDSNARHDPKTTAMRGVYGAKGYGWFWILVEMMREQDGYKLEMRSKYAFHAFASQMHCEPTEAQQFIEDCVNEFGLFASDGFYFWSESLLRRMQKFEEKSTKARASARARWGQKTASDQGSAVPDDADSSGRNANASKNDALKESKANESRGKESKGEEDNAPPAPAPPPMNPFRMFEAEGFGTISPVLADKLNDLIDDFGERWVCEALKESALSGKRNIRYVTTILERYRSEGVDEPWKVDRRPVRTQQRGNGKPDIPIVEKPSTAPTLTPEEMEALMERARRFDERGKSPREPVT